MARSRRRSTTKRKLKSRSSSNSRRKNKARKTRNKTRAPKQKFKVGGSGSDLDRVKYNNELYGQV